MKRILLILFSVLTFAVSPALAHWDVDKPAPGSQGRNNSGNAAGGRVEVANCSDPTSSAELDINNVRALLHNGGDAWWDLNANPRYEVPKVDDPTQVKKHSMFGGGIWIGAIDPENNYLVCAQTYRQGNPQMMSYWPGPLDQTGNTERSICSAWDRHFKVNRSVVNEFAASWYPGITVDLIPREVINWPGRNNPHLANPVNPYYIADFAGVDLDKDLAPFVDSDGDGVYNPVNGDYPLLPGAEEGSGADQCIWYVTNDAGNQKRFTGNQPVLNFGMEIQTEAFGYATSDPTNNMTFYRHKLINKGNYLLENTYFGQWVDPDLGNAYDDYVEVDVPRGLGICYNGDDFDDGVFGYGFNPPSVAVDFFRGPFSDEGDGVDNDKDGEIDEIDSVPDPFNPNRTLYLTERIILSNFLYYNNDGDPLNGNPSLAVDYFNYLRNLWRDGSQVSYDLEMGKTPVGQSNPNNGFGPTQPSKFIFPGYSDQANDAGFCWNPGCPPPWDERIAGNPPGDRRFLSSAGPFTLRPGMINELTIGVVWARASSGGATGSFNQLMAADDIAQKLFDNGFQILSGPNAPDIQMTELDGKLIMSIIPDSFRISPTGPLMTTETYQERDRSLRSINGDVYYHFQGYKIYQLRRENVSTGELDNEDQARLIAQCDVKDGVGNIINSTYSPELDADIPKLMVEGADDGIFNSLLLDRDYFATEQDGLINFKKYYYMVIAYAYNSNSLNEVPYLQGRGNVKVITAIPHKTEPTNGGTIVNANYGDLLPVKKLAGYGSGDVTIEITDELEDNIVQNYSVDNLMYKPNQSPVRAKIFDPLRIDGDTRLRVKLSGKLVFSDKQGSLPIEEGDTLVSSLDYDPINANQRWFALNYPQTDGIAVVKNVLENSTLDIEVLNAKEGGRFNTLYEILTQLPQSSGGGIRFEGYGSVDSPFEIRKPGGGVDTATCTAFELYNYYEIMDYSDSLQPILVGQSIPFESEKLLFDKGISITINPTFSPGFETMIHLGNGFRESSFKFEGADQWLQPVNSSWRLIPEVLREERIDPIPVYRSLGEGLWSAYGDAATNISAFSFGAYFDFNQSVNLVEASEGAYRVRAIQGLHNIDVVFTPDRSKWSRVPVLQIDTTRSQWRFHKSRQVSKDINGSAEIGLKSPYVHNGTELQSTGMSWFPGYAFDHDRGIRLNIVLAEDRNYNPVSGDDLHWTPSTLAAGSKEFIYIVNEKYDAGKVFEYKSDSAYNDTRFRINAFRGELNRYRADSLMNNFVLVGNMRLSNDFEGRKWDEIPGNAEVRFKLRVDRAFQAYGDGVGSPEYGFATQGVAVQKGVTSVAKGAIDKIRIVPNPYYANSLYETSQVDNRVKFVNLPKKCVVTIYSLNGSLVRQFRKDDNRTWFDWDLRTAEQLPIASGSYIIHVDAGELGEKVLKFFAVVRPIDLDTF